VTRALNFTPAAVAALRGHPCPGAPITRASNRWIADLLERAEVFILPDCGELLDRSRPKPEVPGLMFRPPFPVVACEYLAQNSIRPGGFYNASPCSKRIALAWDWTGDLPAPLLAAFGPAALDPGVCVISVFYSDEAQTWVCNSAATHLPYEGEWMARGEMAETPFIRAMIADGSLAGGNLKAKGYVSNFLPLMIEFLEQVRRETGSVEGALDIARADNNDEVNAYIDLCYALACKNVSAERSATPKILNRERRRKGRPELKDFHVLNLGGDGTGQLVGSADRSLPRSHLRRGHIRRLGADRVTWVNQTMVHGRDGFVSKTYKMKGAA
jgi:hypothetical protein